MYHDHVATQMKKKHGAKFTKTKILLRKFDIVCTVVQFKRKQSASRASKVKSTFRIHKTPCKFRIDKTPWESIQELKKAQVETVNFRLYFKVIFRQKSCLKVTVRRWLSNKVENLQSQPVSCLIHILTLKMSCVFGICFLFYFFKLSAVHGFWPRVGKAIEIFINFFSALLELHGKIKYSRYARPIKLLRNGIKFHPGHECYIAGWGHTYFSGVLQKIIREVKVKLVSRKKCNSPKSYNGSIHERAICAGYEAGGRDACQYDSGGPLFCTKKVKSAKWYLVGQVSWGDKCALPHKYGVYSNMEALGPWVLRTIRATAKVYNRNGWICWFLHKSSDSYLSHRFSLFIGWSCTYRIQHVYHI